MKLPAGNRKSLQGLGKYLVFFTRLTIPDN